MAKIQKQGLDYFPLTTHFVHQRLVRRIMKQEGDVAPLILLITLSRSYGEEGYYVEADPDLYQDIACELYQADAEKVERVLRLAVDTQLFDRRLFEERGVLTSAEIQEQYLFSSRRRKNVSLHPDLCLLPPEQVAELTGKADEKPNTLSLTREVPQKPTQPEMQANDNKC
ncbi:MAG: DUF4373 domain-containing protein, partial [Mediterranea sp.]|nr:DUF4373 domain-containing protein [Mediterranea sp.]